jgi:SAM-dependent methyltransferase
MATVETVTTRAARNVAGAAGASDTVDWRAWLRRWDAQQTGYLPDREGRFEVMLDALAVLLPPDFLALDLCAGPGSISERLLARFPKARCIAADKDPVLLAVGQGALGDAGGRLRWVDADLLDPGWADALGVERVDAVLSTTALHWLTADQLARVYRRLGQLVRPGGVFLNGDHMKFGPHLPGFRAVADAVKAARLEDAHGRRGVESWQAWWDALAQEPGAAALLAERERRFADRTREGINPGFDFQVGALRDAGFGEVDVLWQNLDNRVLMAIRAEHVAPQTPD